MEDLSVLPGFPESSCTAGELRSRQKNDKEEEDLPSLPCWRLRAHSTQGRRGNDDLCMYLYQLGRQFSGIKGYPTQMHERTKGTNRDP